jgi:hypothetical protein
MPGEPFTPTAVRLRALGLGLMSLLMTSAAVWALVAGSGIRDIAAGVAGIALFGAATIFFLRDALIDRRWAPGLLRDRTPSPIDRLIVPTVLIFVVPMPLKIPLAVPLLLAWIVLMPRPADRRLVIAAAVVAATIALLQALFFAAFLWGAFLESTSAKGVALQAVLSAMVACLDLQLGLEVRRRLRGAKR